MLTFKKFADLQIRLEDLEKFQELVKQYDITVENIDRANIYRNGRNIPQNLYFVQVSYMAETCLFELGFELGKLTLH